MRPIRKFAALLIFSCVAFVASACSADNRLVVHSASGDHVFTVEIASSASERSRGLMFRQELADDAGMLFDFHEERPVSFWMQNTLIPLDMIFIATDGEIKSIHENARPLDTTSIPSEFPVQFVLEIPGGRASKLGIAPGDTVEHSLIGQ